MGTIIETALPICKLRANATIPTYGSEYAAGADLYACLDEPVDIASGDTFFVPTGIAMEIPVGCAGFIYARSGLSCKQGLAPANKVGVIDADYRGEIMVALHNHSKQTVTLNPGDRVAQIVIAPYYKAQFSEVSELGDTKRGAGGFGSTGTN